MLHEDVEAVVMRPVAGAFDIDQPRVLEVTDPPVDLGIGGRSRAEGLEAQAARRRPGREPLCGCVRRPPRARLMPSIVSPGFSPVI